MIHISCAFDGGNIDVLDSSDPAAVKLAIRKDHQSDFYQWFYFRASNLPSASVSFHIENAGGAAYLEGWENYHACISTDRESWTRIPTRYDGKRLMMTVDGSQYQSLYIAYFAPYTTERHLDLLGYVADHQGECPVEINCLGETLDGRPLDLIRLGTPEGDKKTIWMIARQHPGESMAEWWMEGALEALLDSSNPVSRALLEKAVFYIVPNMNPDGSARGHLRTNAAGVNLNRVWHNPQMATEPEVALVRAKMLETGVDAHIDVHGDEALPYNFLAGYESIPNMRPGQAELFERFSAYLVAASPDFQTQYGYPLGEPGTSDLKKCTDWTANQFGCLAMTLEMPFKDNADLPDDVFGWSPDRCKKLAEACLSVFEQITGEL